MRAAFHTLGCKVNQYDTQAMLELMEDAGYTVVPFSEEADVYVLNTCTVTGTGDKKSLQLARRIRREHPDALLVLCGCLAQREGEKLLSDAGADLILGTQYRAQIVRLVEKVRSTGTALSAVSPLVPGMPFEDLSIREVSGHTRATVKIQEGCGNHCTYCIIPSVRGPVRSRPLENLRQEIERLRDAGFSEIVLTGIHLVSYGRDFREAPLSLLDAIRTVHLTEGIQRIRLGSLEPVIATESFCLALKDLPKVCPQFHLALQSGSDTVLARMKRRYNTDQYRKAVANIRAVWPNAALTTDILTGFPGETEEQFNELLDFIKEAKLDRVGCFPYSDVDGATANTYLNPVDEQIREERAARLMELQSQISYEKLEARVGKEYQVLIDYVSDDGVAVGRSKYESPDIDGVISIPNTKDVQVGDLVKAVITGHDEHDMEASLVSKTTGSISFLKK